MKKILIFGLCSVASVVGGIVGKRAVDAYFADRREARVYEALSGAASAVNAKAPQMVDEATRLERAEVGPGRRFTWVYTLVSTQREQIDAVAFSATVKPGLIEKVRVSEGLQPLIAIGTTLVYRYLARDGTLIADVIITPADVHPK